jgi:glycosyltransferase involved in cell wall biosynthesis
MKIACVGLAWYPQSPGGLEKYMFGMMHALLRAGDSVDVFVNGEPELENARGRAYSIGAIDSPLWRRMLAARSAYAKHFHEPYDVIDLHFALNALPLIPFIKHRAPRVVHFHGPWAAESVAEGNSTAAGSIKAALERFVYHRADSFIVLSSAFKDVLAGYGVEPSRIRVIPMGIDTVFFAPAADRQAVRAALGWPSGATVFFTARRLINRVGVMQLLEAARLVRATHENFVVKIAGKGPLRAELESAILAQGLSDCVELLGFVSEEELVRCYQAADVTVLPTQSLEGFGTIISESLACGTPVIVTPVGGMPEAVAHLDPELVARSAAAEGIADAMERAVRGTLALPGRERCRTFAVQNFDWTTVYGKIRSVFTEATAGRT